MSQEEKIYTGEDMQSVLDAVGQYKIEAALARKEAEQSKQLLWAVVDSMGGDVAVPYNIWNDPSRTKEIIMWDDPQTFQLRLKTQDGSTDE